MDEKLKFASFSHISLDIFKAAIYDKHHKPTPRKLSHRPSREPKSKTRETIHYSDEIPRRFFPRNHISKNCAARQSSTLVADSVVFKPNVPQKHAD